MQHAIGIPAPSGADNETVITALETAELFRSKGDRHEAMHWLRRAAESAGEAGDDERALSLSRVVADLHDELEATPASPSAPYPPPPSSRAAQAAPASVRPSRPPAPSARPSRPPLSSTRPSTPPRPSARPSYTGSMARPPTSSIRPTLDVAAAPAAVSAPEPARAATPPPLPAAAPATTPAPVHAKGTRHAEIGRAHV